VVELLISPEKAEVYQRRVEKRVLICILSPRQAARVAQPHDV